MTDLLDRYRRLLATVDAWFGRVASRFPVKVACRRGCSECCHGLFDVTPLDAALLQEGLAALPEAERSAIRERARAVLEKAVALEPRLAGRPDLAGLSDAAVDALCDAAGNAPCPVLAPDGACHLYAHRPMVCRMNGIVLMDPRGRVVNPEGCHLNTLRAGDALPSVLGLDVKAVRKEEERLLEALGAGWIGRLIAQALQRPGDVPPTRVP
jgi:Fe-S-cluster containining protein